MTSPNSPYQGDPNQPQNGQAQPNQYQQQPNGFAAPQQPQKKKGGCLKWGAIIIGVLIVLGIIGGALGGDSEDADTTGSSNSSEDTGAGVGEADANKEAPAEEEAPAAEEAQPAELAPGQTYTTSDNLEITVNSVTTASNALGTYIAANITYLNNGDEPASFNQFQWNLQTPAGVVSDSTITGFDDALGSGDLTPGGTVTGVVYFDGSEPGEYLVTWEPTLSFSGDKGTWKAGI
ncbi:DUF4352 domain-containing protein [Corynebacterium casei]|uniref:DUF4352 domain-containing protein n=1 Tax=Corynebacterium casei TaxID=160386 RepID=UPI003FCFC338